MDSSATTPKKNSAASLLRALRFLCAYPGYLAGALGLVLLMIGIELSLPQILGSAITQLRLHMSWGAAFDARASLLLFLSLVLVRAGLGVILGPIRNRLIHLALSDIRLALYSAIQRFPFRYHDKANTGELISRSTTDVWRLQDFFFACLLLSVDIAVSLVATTTLIFQVNTRLGWITLGTTLPTLLLIVFYARKLQPQWRSVHDLHASMTTVIQENIAGVRVVKAFAREASQVERFRDKRDSFARQMLHTLDYWSTRVPFSQFIFGLTTPLVLWLGGRAVIAGQMPLGDLAKVVFYLMAIGHRMGLVGQFTNILQNASASAERIEEILHDPQQMKGGKTVWPAQARGEVRFEGVTFHYRDGLCALTDVSFTAPAGRIVAVVGATGAGKSTLIHLIPRFYDPTHGRVLIDGVEVKELELASLRRQIGIIFQETFLFSASIAENIAYGKPGATLEEIQHCARAAQADEFIQRMEKGYHTLIGERGVSLSGGQKQRLAIARAFLMDPKILLLDDATASVDSHTERLIQEAMRQLCQGRTTFVIAHRLSTVQHSDHVLVLHQGRLVEEGRHEDLLKAGGHYCRIFNQELREQPVS